MLDANSVSNGWTGMTACDLAVYTDKGLGVVTIKFDREDWENLKAKSN